MTLYRILAVNAICPAALIEAIQLQVSLAKFKRTSTLVYDRCPTHIFSTNQIGLPAEGSRREATAVLRRV